MNELDGLIAMLKENHFREKTLILADGGYESYNAFYHLLEKPNATFAVRVKQHHGALREVAKLPMLQPACDISFTLTTTQTNTDKEKRYIINKIKFYCDPINIFKFALMKFCLQFCLLSTIM